MQKEILTELEDLRDETEFIINNQEIVENKHIENYLRSFERIRNNLFNKIKLSNKYEVNEQDKITYLNDRYSATVENDVLKIYIPEVIPKYKNINNCAYKNIMLNVMDKTKEYKDLFGVNYKTDREDEHCSICSCNSILKTSSLGSDCGLSYYNETHPDNIQELKFTKYNKQ